MWTERRVIKLMLLIQFEYVIASYIYLCAVSLRSFWFNDIKTKNITGLRTITNSALHKLEILLENYYLIS